MKKLMTLMMALVPFGMMAQSSQDSYASADEIFNSSFADLGDVVTEETSNDDFFKVSDVLLADPDFDIQENMIAYTKDQKTVYFSANRKLKVKKGNETDVKIDLADVGGNQYPADGRRGRTDNKGHRNHPIDIHTHQHGHFTVLGSRTHGLSDAREFDHDGQQHHDGGGCDVDDDL